jgi:hypothetical protein
LKLLKKMRGGSRPNSGNKKGVKFAKTIAKEEARELTRQIITGHLEGLISAQLDNAQGIRHLMMRDPATGKFERIKNETNDPKVEQAQIDAALKSGNAVWIYTKDPSVQAFTDLLNRALDKPAEQVKVTGENGGPVIFKWQE